MKVFIVGGGIGGLAAAISLRQAGIDAHIYEQAPHLKEVGAGLSLWANGVKALHHLGLDLRKAASPLHRLQSRRPHGVVLHTAALDAFHRGCGFSSVAIHRGELLQLLADALHHPDVIHLGRRLRHVIEADEQVTAEFVDGPQVSADALGANLFWSLRE